MGVDEGNLQVMDDDVEMTMQNCPITIPVDTYKYNSNYSVL